MRIAHADLECGLRRLLDTDTRLCRAAQRVRLRGLYRWRMSGAGRLVVVVIVNAVRVGRARASCGCSAGWEGRSERKLLLDGRDRREGRITAAQGTGAGTQRAERIILNDLETGRLCDETAGRQARSPAWG